MAAAMTSSILTRTSEQKRHIRFIIYLLILGAFVIFYRLGDRDMWNGLESEAAVAGWDMVETGRILIPHILDQPFIDNRPPGAWWLIAATYKLTGVRNTWTARLPSALAALVCVLLVYAMGRRAANANSGFVSALMLMGMLYFVLLGRTSQQDMLLTLATTLCLWAFWRSLDNNQAVLRFVMAFQIFLGFGVLMKGPAVVINIFSSLAVYIIYSRCWRDVKWVSFMVTLPVSLCLSLWWYIYVWVGWPSMRDVLVHRFTDQASIHVEAFYFYYLHLPELLGPVLLFLPLLALGWRKASPAQRRGPLGLFSISAVTMFIVYCLFASKRTHYLGPLLPSLSLALGLMIEGQRLDQGRCLPISTLIIATLNPLLILVWIFAAPAPMRIGSALREWGMFAILTGIVTWSWVMLRAGRRRASWKTAWIGCIIALAFFMGDIYQRAGNTLLSREFAERVARAVPDNAQIGTLDDHAALLFHLGRHVEYIQAANASHFLENPNHYLIVDKESDLEQIDEKLRQAIVLKYPYRHRHPAYLLHDGQGQKAHG
jgi:4-amino-4-deoxy-L-arabinose transferase-like glycosyltransferase